MKFTLRHCLAWVLVSFVATASSALLFGGGWFTLMGVSLALNLVLSWLLVGHDSMLLALGLQPNQPPH